MSWQIEYISKAREDFLSLDHSQQIQVNKALAKVSQNPLPTSEGGYGKPLGNYSASKLYGCYKVKLSKVGLRIGYSLVRDKEVMKVIIIAIRDDSAVYRIAERRL